MSFFSHAINNFPREGQLRIVLNTFPLFLAKEFDNDVFGYDNVYVEKNNLAIVLKLEQRKYCLACYFACNNQIFVCNVGRILKYTKAICNE